MSKRAEETANLLHQFKVGDRVRLSEALQLSNGDLLDIPRGSFDQIKSECGFIMAIGQAYFPKIRLYEVDSAYVEFPTAPYEQAWWFPISDLVVTETLDEARYANDDEEDERTGT